VQSIPCGSAVPGAIKIHRGEDAAPTEALIGAGTDRILEALLLCLFCHLQQQLIQAIYKRHRIIKLTAFAQHRLVQQHVRPAGKTLIVSFIL